jgi:hypothetical protein
MILYEVILVFPLAGSKIVAMEESWASLESMNLSTAKVLFELDCTESN